MKGATDAMKGASDSIKRSFKSAGEELGGMAKKLEDEVARSTGYL